MKQLVPLKNRMYIVLEDEKTHISILLYLRSKCKKMTFLPSLCSTFSHIMGSSFRINSDAAGIQKKGEGELAFFSAKRWDHRNRADLIESATLCHDAYVVGSYRVSNPLRLTVRPAKSEDSSATPSLVHS